MVFDILYVPVTLLANSNEINWILGNLNLFKSSKEERSIRGYNDVNQEQETRNTRFL